ncbi:unnamed protein product, partial [marine sediment metagenome]
VVIILIVVFIVFASYFMYARQYLWAFLTLFLIFVLIAPETIKRVKLSVGKDGVEATYEKAQEEKIKKDIQENKEPITRERIKFFRDIENKIIKDAHRKLGGELKREIHYVYGDKPEKPEFMFTPDGTIKVDNKLIFIEIKHIIHPELARNIINNGIKQLQLILDRFKPMAGADLEAKLIIASSVDLDIRGINAPDNINIEFLVTKRK